MLVACLYQQGPRHLIFGAYVALQASVRKPKKVVEPPFLGQWSAILKLVHGRT